MQGLLSVPGSEMADRTGESVVDDGGINEHGIVPNFCSDFSEPSF